MDVDALLSPLGTEALAAAESLGDTSNGDELALATRLRARFPAALVADALDQTRLRAAARAKFTRPDDLLFTRDGLEQASPAAVSAHRAERLRGFGRVADLCCGVGGDLLALAADHSVLAVDRSVLAVDRDPLHLRLALHNASAAVPEARVDGMCADVRDVSLAGVEAVFVDPARRGGPDRRLDGEPPLAWCAGLPVPTVVKAAPAVPDELVPDGWEAEFVALGRELKEAALWSPALATAHRRATVLTGDGAVSLVAVDGAPVPVVEPGAFLLDPNPAVTRAGLVTSLARMIGAAQIDERIAFLTSSDPVESPFARCLPVLESLPWQEKSLIAALRRVGASAVEVRRRGLAGDVDALTAKLRRALRSSAGDRRVLVCMTRVRDRPWAIICAA